MKQTPLYGRHQALGAKIIDFGGWAMPVQYSGILDEHKAVRQAAGIFDVSHMGEVWFRGPRAAEAVQRLVTNDVGKLADGGAMYSCACRPTGGIVDDLIVYRTDGQNYLIVVNASNVDKDFGWFREQAGALCDIINLSDETGLLAVQGPHAVALVQSIADRPVDDLEVVHLSRSAGRRRQDAGRAHRLHRRGRLRAVRAGERDRQAVGRAPRRRRQVRPEAHRPRRARHPAPRGALSLYGNDIDEEHTPHEAGLSWVVKGKGFIGEAALAQAEGRGPRSASSSASS